MSTALESSMSMPSCPLLSVVTPLTVTLVESLISIPSQKQSSPFPLAFMLVMSTSLMTLWSKSSLSISNPSSALLMVCPPLTEIELVAKMTIPSSALLSAM